MKNRQKYTGGGYNGLAVFSAFVKIAATFAVAAILFSACSNASSSSDDDGGVGGVARESVIINGTSYEKTREFYVTTHNVTFNGNQNKEKGSEGDSGAAVTDWTSAFIEGRPVENLPPFVMGQYEVTRELYQAVVDSLPDGEQTDGGKNLFPVGNVTWQDAAAFCNKLTEKIGITDSSGEIDYAYYTSSDYKTKYEKGNAIHWKRSSKGYRLPTEVEWEFAARGGNPYRPAWGWRYAGADGKNLNDGKTTTDDALDAVAWYSGNSSVEGTARPHEVGTRAPNALGLYDMSGNVGEWCWDYYGEIKSDTPITGPGPQTGSNRVFRGGSFASSPAGCAVFCRSSAVADKSEVHHGFRVCRSL